MPGKLVSVAELAHLLGVHRNTVLAWVQRGCPLAERGSSGRGNEHKFDLAAVVRWREDEAARAATGNTEGLDLDVARLRKVAGEAALIELEVQKKRGQLVEIDAVASVVGEKFAACRSRLLSLPTKLAPLLAASTDVNETQVLLEQGINEALSELSGDGIAGAPGEGDSGADVSEPAASSEAPGQRVGGRTPKAVRRKQRRAGPVDNSEG